MERWRIGHTGARSRSVRSSADWASARWRWRQACPRFGSSTLWAGTFVFGLISAALMMRIAPVEAVPAASLDSLNANLPTGGVT